MDAWMHGCMDAWVHGCMDGPVVCIVLRHSRLVMVMLGCCQVAATPVHIRLHEDSQISQVPLFVDDDGHMERGEDGSGTGATPTSTRRASAASRRVLPFHDKLATALKFISGAPSAVCCGSVWVCVSKAASGPSSGCAHDCCGSSGSDSTPGHVDGRACASRGHCHGPGRSECCRSGSTSSCCEADVASPDDGVPCGAAAACCSGAGCGPVRRSSCGELADGGAVPPSPSPALTSCTSSGDVAPGCDDAAAPLSPSHEGVAGTGQCVGCGGGECGEDSSREAGGSTSGCVDDCCAALVPALLRLCRCRQCDRGGLKVDAVLDTVNVVVVVRDVALAGHIVSAVEAMVHKLEAASKGHALFQVTSALELRVNCVAVSGR